MGNQWGNRWVTDGQPMGNQWGNRWVADGQPMGNRWVAVSVTAENLFFNGTAAIETFVTVEPGW